MDSSSFVMSGGRLLGQGAYGCVFDPPLICRGKNAPVGGWKTSRLGKLGVSDDVKNELTAAELFKNKPESKKYFLLPILETVCKKNPGESPVIESEQKEKDLSKCGPLAEKGVNNMQHFEMEYGGKVLSTALSNIQLRVQDFNFFKFMEDILEIGAYLALNGYIHNDLHTSNIVVNKNYHPRLIDFGRSYYSPRIDKLTVDGFIARYDPTLNQIAPECTARDGIYEGIPFKRIADDLFKEKIGFINAEKLFGVDRNEQKAEFIKFWNNSKTAQTQDWVTFFKLYWPVADSWSIGAILSKILIKLTFSVRFVEGEPWGKQWKEKRPVIKEVVTGLLKASPKQRLDCVEALSMYNPMNAVVVSSAGRNWLDKKQEGRKIKV
jgi:serine/threonine protein kinase